MKSVMRAIPLAAILFLTACQSREIATLPAKPQWTAVQRQSALASVPAALARAEQISDTDIRMFAYWMIATSQIKAGDAPGALKTLDLAQAAAAKISNDEQHQMLAYRGIAGARAAAGDVNGARKMVTLTDEITEQVGTYLVIAEAQAKAGDMKGARKTFDLAKATTTRIGNDPAKKARIYLHIAELQVEAGDTKGIHNTLDLAAKNAEQIKDDDDSLFDGEQAIHRCIVQLQLKTGDLIGAKANASTLNEGYERQSIYHEIAKAQADAGLIIEARATAAGLRSKGDDATRLSNDEQEVYQYIIAAQVKAGGIDGAKLTAALLNEAWDGYNNLGKAYAQADNMTAAREAFESAKKAVESINTSKDTAYEEIARAQADAGDPTAAKETLARVERLHYWAYRQLAVAQAKAGDFATAKQTVEPFARYKSSLREAYKSILDAQLKAGDIDGARKTVAEDLDGCLAAYQTMIRFQAKVGDIDGVRETAKLVRFGNHFTVYAQLDAGNLAGAIVTAALIDEADTKQGVHLNIAEAQAEAGELTAAVESIARAEKLNWNWTRRWNWDRLPWIF
ncbi:MAG: hypothetical protein FWD53_10040 [Phycisphaerales bacterium]|nr:hypothetical protein [Phycisphaerales bacterium]